MCPLDQNGSENGVRRMTQRNNELSDSDLAQLAETAWVVNDGARAHAAGIDRLRCPWPKGTYFYDCWCQGFGVAEYMRRHPHRPYVIYDEVSEMQFPVAPPICQLCAGTGKLDVDGSGVPGKCPACADRELYASSADRQRQTCPTCGK